LNPEFKAKNPTRYTVRKKFFAFLGKSSFGRARFVHNEPRNVAGMVTGHLIGKPPRPAQDVGPLSGLAQSAAPIVAPLIEQQKTLGSRFQFDFRT
jgi:hypothetical protein